MATVKKTIGRLPVYKGDWVAGTYSMLNQVSYLGSTFQSKIDNNTAIPATVVNNALQVNANWSVVSNGTAAYLADARLTSAETAIAYAQAGVDTLRSDVQGCICTYDDRNNYFIKDSSQFSIAFYITGSLIASASDIVVCGYPGSDSALYFGYNTAGIRYRQYTPNLMALDNTKTDGYFVVTFDSGTVKMYCNGVLVSTTTGFITTQSIRRYITGWENRGVSLSRLQFFNNILTQQQIDTLYNQGRCNEVVLSDDLKSICINEYIPRFLTKTKWIDSGANKQDITLTSPTFTYVKPYKQYSNGTGAPNVIPNAAHIEYTDVATGNIWKCGGKPNTRQFAVSDWKQINN